MDNPLFGTDVFSPPPPGHGSGINNPVFAAAAPATAGVDLPFSARRPFLLDAHQPLIATHHAHSTPTTTTTTTTAAAMGRDRSEEVAFADAMNRLVRGETDAAETIACYADNCRQRAQELHNLASSQLQQQRTARAMALNEAAAELEAEAATWQLLWFLHGIPGMEFPAGRGGDFVEGAAFAKTFRQLAADVLFQDEVLNRAGRAVAWLEASAAAADPEPEQGLARKDGVWQETRGKLSSTSSMTTSMTTSMTSTTTKSGSLITELDPDATTRQSARLDADNIKDEERLMRIVWRLIRGGRGDRAVGACLHAGQPWRAASLSGSGGSCAYGALPLGAAAEDADAADNGARQMEILAGEVEVGGAAVGRALWRWACYQAAERVDRKSVV